MKVFIHEVTLSIYLLINIFDEFVEVFEVLVCILVLKV